MLANDFPSPNQLPDIAFPAQRPAERLREGSIDDLQPRANRLVFEHSLKFAVGPRVIPAQIGPGGRLNIEGDLPIGARAERVQDVPPRTGRHMAAGPAVIAIHIVQGRNSAAPLRFTLGRSVAGDGNPEPLRKVTPIHCQSLIWIETRVGRMHRPTRERQNSTEAPSWIVRPEDALVTLPKFELVMFVFGLPQRTKLNGF